MSKKKIDEDEIPYEKLEKVGLNRQLIEDFPEDIHGRMLQGQLSPVLSLTIKDEEGQDHTCRAKFSLYKDEKGETGVRIHPVMEPIEKTMVVASLNRQTGKMAYLEIPTSERYSDEIIAQLKVGKVIHDYMYMEDGSRKKAFLQLDQETNGILGVSSDRIMQNIEVVIKALKLSISEQNCLQKGIPVTFAEDDEMLTVGLDLNAPTGIRFATGDDKKWKEEKKRDWDKYELAVNGCWMTDDEGNLQYIPEEEYDDYDIWTEIEKQREKKAHEAHSRLR